MFAEWLPQCPAMLNPKKPGTTISLASDISATRHGRCFINREKATSVASHSQHAPGPTPNTTTHTSVYASDHTLCFAMWPLTVNRAACSEHGLLARALATKRAHPRGRKRTGPVRNYESTPPIPITIHPRFPSQFT
eukprot:11604704-Alexandrium_andersonii.AAC.1